MADFYFAEPVVCKATDAKSTLGSEPFVCSSCRPEHLAQVNPTVEFSAELWSMCCSLQSIGEETKTG